MIELTLTPENKKILSRIFSRFLPLIKGTTTRNGLSIDLVNIIQSLPINLKIYSVYLKDEDYHWYSAGLASTRSGLDKDFSNIELEISLYINKSSEDHEISDEEIKTFLNNIFNDLRKISYIVSSILKIFFSILFKFYNSNIRTKYISMIVKSLSVDIDTAVVLYNIYKYIFLDIICFSLTKQSPIGIYKYLPISEYQKLFAFFNKDNPSFEEVIEKLNQAYDDNNLKINNSNIWDRMFLYSGHLVSYDFKFYDFDTIYKTNDDQNGNDSEMYLDDIVYTIRNQLLEKYKGEQSAKMLASLGVPIEVTVDWVKQLKGLILTEANHYTSKKDISYRKIKNKYRHIAMLPGEIHYDNSLISFAVIDQSGSVSDMEIRKINFVIQKLAEKSKELHLIIHDYDIVDYKIFKGNMSGKVLDYLSRRRSYGGTSHVPVFQKIQEYYEEHPKNKFIILTLSDMYSNIEQCEQDFPILRNPKISKYWVSTSNHNPSVPGIHINIDKGILEN